MKSIWECKEYQWEAFRVVTLEALVYHFGVEAGSTAPATQTIPAGTVFRVDYVGERLIGASHNGDGQFFSRKDEGTEWAVV